MNMSFESSKPDTSNIPPFQGELPRDFSDHTAEMISSLHERLQETNDRIREIEGILSSLSLRSLFSRATLQDELTRCYHDRHRLEAEIAQRIPVPMEVAEGGVVLEEEEPPAR